jgi:hypothetical protein
MAVESTGKLLIVAGVVLVIVGVGLHVAGRLGLPLGRLPGDIRIERPGGGLYIPVTSWIVLSVVLTIAVNVIMRLLRK